ncbi:hypothetical protein BKA81DRAFT_380871 [Phyllosticta paracitricarpa]
MAWPTWSLSLRHMVEKKRRQQPGYGPDFFHLKLLQVCLWWFSLACLPRGIQRVGSSRVAGVTHVRLFTDARLTGLGAWISSVPHQRRPTCHYYLARLASFLNRLTAKPTSACPGPFLFVCFAAANIIIIIIIITTITTAVASQPASHSCAFIRPRQPIRDPSIVPYARQTTATTTKRTQAGQTILVAAANQPASPLSNSLRSNKGLVWLKFLASLSLSVTATMCHPSALSPLSPDFPLHMRGSTPNTRPAGSPFCSCSSSSPDRRPSIHTYGTLASSLRARTAKILANGNVAPTNTHSAETELEMLRLHDAPAAQGKGINNPPARRARPTNQPTDRKVESWSRGVVELRSLGKLPGPRLRTRSSWSFSCVPACVTRGTWLSGWLAGWLACDGRAPLRSARPFPQLSFCLSRRRRRRRRRVNPSRVLVNHVRTNQPTNHRATLSSRSSVGDGAAAAVCSEGRAERCACGGAFADADADVDADAGDALASVAIYG